MYSRRNEYLRHHMRKSTYVHVTACISNCSGIVVVVREYGNSLTLAPSPLKKKTMYQAWFSASHFFNALVSINLDLGSHKSCSGP